MIWTWYRKLSVSSCKNISLLSLPSLSSLVLAAKMHDTVTGHCRNSVNTVLGITVVYAEDITIYCGWSGSNYTKLWLILYKLPLSSHYQLPSHMGCLWLSSLNKKANRYVLHHLSSGWLMHGKTTEYIFWRWNWLIYHQHFQVSHTCHMVYMSEGN